MFRRATIARSPHGQAALAQLSCYWLAERPGRERSLDGARVRFEIRGNGGRRHQLEIFDGSIGVRKQLPDERVELGRQPADSRAVEEIGAIDERADHFAT